ncbi:MAG TPA: ATP-binding cassette domain-containing protein [Solirubrobacterales bacterium]|jgi:putative ABC transport system ATP-binding protein|nr:ATP-binding cassette domain-containing protein [Solirubrobacterales bacterium]
MAVESLYREPEPEAELREWPVLELRDAFKIYRSEAVETVALRGVDLEVDRGQLTAILGPSGCGKSTLLALAAGLDRASAGDVRSFGTSLVTQSEDELAAYRARGVGIVFQSNNLWPTLTAEENVVAALRLGGVERAQQRAVEALEELGLGKRRDHRVQALSGGEQQRVAIAAAVARRAPLILADEPTGELDTANQQVVLSALRRLPSEHDCAVVVVTHSRVVAGAADQVVELRDGAVVR